MPTQTVPPVHEIAEALQRDLATTSRRNFIGGAWVEAASGRTFDVLNPATGTVLARCADSHAEDVDRAVRAARAAFEPASPWRRMAPAERMRILWRIGDLIDRETDRLAVLESLDNGKTVVSARAYDVPNAKDQLQYIRGWANRAEGRTIPVAGAAAPQRKLY